MKQLVQLQENSELFLKAGISIVALTYDAPALQQPFIEAHQISYPLLSDVDAKSVIALDILNSSYEPSQSAYGIPYPGVFVVNPEMKIVGKLFVEPYQTRVHAQGVLSYAEAQLAATRRQAP
ncbi:MAG: redoxin domain-containing protein [Gammaproteobacteria bacterium]|jgi:peroxiredoxin|nr:redoxin domain-containing protein [Gammaproteobacteria bacterium]MBT5202510.1 redoxin domain-containing protein [Gammaproteobacteria bacterium]MBT6247136.1 redoxin domain-containing protein [Gammaproteobacteria bacterium]